MRTPVLNDDVVDAIADQFRPDPDFLSFNVKTCHYSTLCNLCRVSKQWLHPSRIRLYHTFERLERIRSSSLLVEASEASPNLGQLVRRVFVQERKLVDHIRLFPNVNALWIASLAPGHFEELVQLVGMKDFVYQCNCGDMWSERQWMQVAEAWRCLEKLVILGPCPRFGPNAIQATIPFASLRLLELQRGHLTVDRIPTTVSHTLRKIILLKTDKADSDVIELLFHEHCQSLEEFKVEAKEDIELKNLLSLAKAPHMRDFQVRGHEGAVNPVISDVASAPPTMTKLFIDWPDCTPEQARNFMEERKGGSLQTLDIRIRDGAFQDWQEVRVTAKGWGVQFTCRCSFWASS